MSQGLEMSMDTAPKQRDRPCAALKGQIKHARDLVVDQAADVNVKDDAGHAAILFALVAVIESLADHISNEGGCGMPSVADTRRCQDQLGILLVLIKAAADIDAVDRDSCEALMLECGRGMSNKRA